jgi:hypothetical protein
MKDFYVSKSDQFKLRVTVDDCAVPSGLKQLKFINEHYSTEGDLANTSTYEFFLNQDALNHLCKQLTS